VTRVLVVAASAVTRAGLEAILAREPSFVVVGESATSTSLGEEIAEYEPDVVVIEAIGPDEDILAALRVHSADLEDGSRPSQAFVLLGDELDATQAMRALSSGIRGLLPRDAGPQEIIAAVMGAAAGLVTFAREWADALRETVIDRVATANGTADGAPALTARELEILRMIADGLGNKQIAARLAISEHTVKFHIGSVFAKMHASSRAEAVMIGARRGLIVL
jgi:two-component system, NarL family, response regulator YdfI